MATVFEPKNLKYTNFTECVQKPRPIMHEGMKFEESVVVSLLLNCCCVPGLLLWSHAMFCDNIPASITRERGGGDGGRTGQGRAGKERRKEGGQEER